MRPQKLEDRVRYVLDHFPETRNDDIALQVQLISIYGEPSDIIFRPRLEDSMIRISALRKHREDNIKRVRAKIQNVDGDFLPTDPEIRKKRSITEDEWRAYTSKYVDGGNPAFL